MTNNNCDSCFMPFKKDTGVRESEKYCSLCFKDGKFTYEGGLKGFQKVAYDGMRKRGMNSFKAKLFATMIRYAPRWKGK
ncbi:MAG: zinc ribbon domain-containing protein [bacterium]|nr:zinc ribbon domain-containing protein [bacterium]